MMWRWGRCRLRARARLLAFAGALLVASLLGPAPAAAWAQLLGLGGSSPPPSPSPAPLRATVMPITPMLLPGCPKAGVLDSINPLEFPGRSWQSMSVEQQALHPINLVFMNLAGIPSTDRAGQITPCLESWGIKKSSVKRIKKDYRVATFPAMSTEVLVMRSSRDVFVVFRATDDDWVADFNCMYTEELNSKFNAPLGSKSLHLHKGFWAAYKVVGSQLETEINKALLMVKATNPFASPSVWFVGHSLGGALASITALKLTMDPLFFGRIGGVVTYGSPRVGNEAWQTLYNRKLFEITLRWANYRDFVSALPGKDQVCMSTSTKVLFSFRHVGRAVQLCPTADGMEQFVMHPKGTEGSCTPGEFPSIATHLLGHYFDGWRRAYAKRYGIPMGLVLSTGVHVRSVMCSQCAVAVKQYPLPTNKAARNDGVVTCLNTQQCQDKLLFSLISWSGITVTSFYREDATCDAATFTCQVAIPGSGMVIDAVSRATSNITLEDIANLAAKVVPDSWANSSSTLLGLLTGSGGIDSNSSLRLPVIPGSDISSAVSIASASMNIMNIASKAASAAAKPNGAAKNGTAKAASMAASPATGLLNKVAIAANSTTAAAQQTVLAASAGAPVTGTAQAPAASKAP